MNILTKWLDTGTTDAHGTVVSKDLWIIVMFTVNVERETRDENILKLLLHSTARWAVAFKLQRSPSKCTIIAPAFTAHVQTFYLEAADMKQAETAEYLGFSLTHSGVNNDKTVSRNEKARKTLRFVRSTEIQSEC